MSCFGYNFEIQEWSNEDEDKYLPNIDNIVLIDHFSGVELVPETGNPQEYIRASEDDFVPVKR